MSPLDPKLIQQAVVSGPWAGLVRTGLDRHAIERWDVNLLRRPRVLVPVDVQALYVPPDSQETFVRLPFALTTPDGAEPEPMPPPFADGETRPAGVHVHWAPPDALLRGEIRESSDAAANRLNLPALPDRWVVLRIIAPRGAQQAHVRGWVLEADTAKAIPLADWPARSGSAPATGKTVPRAELNGAAGGSLNWAGIYDAVRNRFSFHDPLDDLAEAAPNGAEADLAAYVVAGWWTESTLDPLDAAQTSASLNERMESLAWRLVEDAEGGEKLTTHARIEEARRASIGIETATRYSAKTAVKDNVRSTPAVQLQQIAHAQVPFEPMVSMFVDPGSIAVSTEPRWPRSTLLHGSVHGVPIAGPVPVDRRPRSRDLGVALGHTTDDVAAALAAAGISASTIDERRALERILAAFTGQLLPRLGTADGVVDIEQNEHASAFAALPGGHGAVDRLLPAGEAGPLPAGRAARAAHAQAGRAGRPAKKTAGGATRATPGVTIEFKRDHAAVLSTGGADLLRHELREWHVRRDGAPLGRGSSPGHSAGIREVRRPAPRFHLPLEPSIAVRGGWRHLRHGFDGRFSPDGRLQCRWPTQVPTAVSGVIDGAELLPSLGSGAVPPEVLPLVRSAVVTDPYFAPWVARTAAARHNRGVAETEGRIFAEAALRFGATGIYDGTASGMVADNATRQLAGVRIADQLRRFSLVAGVDVDPVGLTAWAQPWVPLWLEWEVELRVTDRLDGWHLGAVDLEPDDTAESDVPPRRIAGRSPLHGGTATTLAAAIDQWRIAEEQRDTTNTGEASEAVEDALSRIAGAVRHLDVLSASLDGLHDHLLGLPVGEMGVVHERDGDTMKNPVPVDVPQLLLTGLLRLVRARLVDAFGRTVDVPVDGALLPARDEVRVDTAGPSLQLRPRLLRPARWLFRLVDPADLSTASAEATLDQVEPANMINPVAGFLLPDHIDEELEVFHADGTPLGQLLHEPFGGGVAWEIAPGRPGPADAGPMYDLAPAQQLLGMIATGLVTADAAARDGKANAPHAETALSALLRAIDTTLWTVDTFAEFGNEHIAGLVGRPIAVVRAVLRLDIDDDLDELDLSDPAERARREDAYRDLADRAFAVRLGELTRSDDGLLAFFVDDDYSHVRVVDRAVRDGALDSGRGRGQLARFGSNPQVPGIRPIDHPYLAAQDEIVVRPGQVVRLTLLMHPSGRVHLSSGILPRKAIQLARDWVHDGLAVMAPSVRVGPVLIEPGQVRLPKISVFPKDQLWTRRTTPYSWKDDPILSATQAALLPDTPAEVQEGYIRVAPKPEDET
jgi:hypothetical protein